MKTAATEQAQIVTRMFLAKRMSFDEWHPKMMTLMRHSKTGLAEIREIFWAGINALEIENQEY